MSTPLLTSPTSKRAGASVNAYLILKQEGKILLQLRKNTGYYDDMWSLAAGHVEDNESATAGMVREAYEELGITIDPSCLKAVHIMHRKSNRLNIDVFFECTSWEGDLENREPHKCAQLTFFPLASLPSSVIEYNKLALEHIANGIPYSELGWEL